MKVNELSSYGKAFDHMPLEAQILQIKVMFSELIKKYGLFGLIQFMRKVIKTQNQLKKKYGQEMNTRFADVPASAIIEFYMMTSMYMVLSEFEDKDNAFDFVKGIFQKIGPTAHETLYNLKDLLKCKGDVYTNFCELDHSMFENSAKKGFYEIAEIRETDDLQYLRLTRCLNVDALSALGSPELARLGCIADTAGYAPDAMGDKVNLDFRRPCTIASGSDKCEFYYYRKGHAPSNMKTL